MGFTKRRANSKSKILLGNFVEILSNSTYNATVFIIDIKSVATMEDIPTALITPRAHAQQGLSDCFCVSIIYICPPKKFLSSSVLAN